MKLICANFKMNLLKKDILAYLETINKKVANNVVFFPSIPYIEAFKNHNLQVGSQDISFKEFGSITGDTSIKQLQELGITYTILGHSERRNYYTDSNYINSKLQLALTNNLKVILCIGETKEEFEAQKTTEILTKELDDAFKDNQKLLTSENLIIAYEPIWAIGTNKIPTNSCLEETISFIKTYIKENYGINLKVLYGGSVNLENIATLETLNCLDGYLIGGACLKPESFLTLISKVS